ncbi:TPA: DeoR family transcriptional regulator [Staphylococcus pseudintermedius]
MNRLHTFKHVNIKDLADTFKVSEETLRRDLEQLEKDGIVIRKHGGASLVGESDSPYAFRATSNSDKKKLSPLLKESNSIMADSRSTVLEAIR